MGRALTCGQVADPELTMVHSRVEITILAQRAIGVGAHTFTINSAKHAFVVLNSSTRKAGLSRAAAFIVFFKGPGPYCPWPNFGNPKQMARFLFLVIPKVDLRSLRY